MKNNFELTGDIQHLTHYEDRSFSIGEDVMTLALLLIALIPPLVYGLFHGGVPVKVRVRVDREK